MYNMAKKTKDTEVVETPVEETPIATPTTADELSPLIVSLQNELNSVQEQIKASRNEFVVQTDKQLAKIAELDLKISDKQICVDNYTQICDVFLPLKQKELSEANNEALRIKAEAETSLKEVVKREAILAKATAELSAQKVAQDQKEADLNSLSLTLEEQRKEIAENSKTLDPLKKALGIK